jgi:hypothetical protein
MSFSRQQPSKRHEVYLNLSGSIDSQLRDAYAKRHDCGIETQQVLGDKLGVGRYVINRRLLGKTNMTIKTLAEMVWGLGQCIKVDIFNPYDRPSNEALVISEHAVPTDGTVIGVTSINSATFSYAD